MATRLVHITDTHLSARHGFFYGNWRRLLEHVAAEQPQLVIHGGDISVDGADSVEDLRFARAELQRIPQPLLVLPGNHDIGDEPAGDAFHQWINSERYRRYTGVFGETDRWTIDVGPWRLVGLDTQLCGSELDAEEAQLAWLECLIAADPHRPLVLFVHKPLFLEHPDETELDPACTTPAPRRRLLDALAAANLRMVVCGHVHQYRHRFWNEVELIWAPSPAFTTSRVKPGAEALLGYMVFDFEGDRVSHRLVTPLDLRRFDLDALKEYGRYPFLRDMPASPPETWYP